MKHHDLRRINFGSMICRVVKLPSKQFSPVPIRQPIPRPKRRLNILRVTRIRSLLLLLPPKNRPIHHRTIGHHFPNPRIQRSQNGRRATKTPANHKHFLRRDAKPSPKSQLPKLSRQSANHIQNIQVRRPRQKLAATLPRSAIPGIEHPVSFSREKFSQRLFARNRRHPIAQDNRPLRFPRPSRGQELSQNVALESCPEHDSKTKTLRILRALGGLGLCRMHS